MKRCLRWLTEGTVQEVSLPLSRRRRGERSPVCGGAAPQAGGGNMAVTAARTIGERRTHTHTHTQAALWEQRRSVSSLNRLPPSTRRTRSPKASRVDVSWQRVAFVFVFLGFASVLVFHFFLCSTAVINNITGAKRITSPWNLPVREEMTSERPVTMLSNRRPPPGHGQHAAAVSALPAETAMMSGAGSVVLPAGLINPSLPIRNIKMKFAVLVGLIQVGEVSHRDIVETVLNLVRERFMSTHSRDCTLSPYPKTSAWACVSFTTSEGDTQHSCFLLMLLIEWIPMKRCGMWHIKQQ